MTKDDSVLSLSKNGNKLFSTLTAYKDLLPEVVALLECDYIENIPQQGVKVLKKCGLLEKYISAVDDRESLFIDIHDCPPNHYN